MLVNAVTHGDTGGTALRAGITTLTERIGALGSRSGVNAAGVLHADVIRPLETALARNSSFDSGAIGMLDDAVRALSTARRSVSLGASVAEATARGATLLEDASRLLRFVR